MMELQPCPQEEGSCSFFSVSQVVQTEVQENWKPPLVKEMATDTVYFVSNLWVGAKLLAAVFIER